MLPVRQSKGVLVLVQVAQQVGQVQQKAQAALQELQDQVQDQLDSKYSLHIIHTLDHLQPSIAS